MSSNTNTVTPVTTLTKLGPKATQAEIIETLNGLIEKVNSIKVRDRGPKSERSMTDEDAFEVKFGSLKDAGHKDAAKKLGLSYGQVYSCRGAYTFNHVTKDFNKS